MTAIVLTLIATPAAQASSSASRVSGFPEAATLVALANGSRTSGDARRPVTLRGREADSSRSLQAVTQRLRHGVSERRRAAFRHADWLGVQRHKTAYRERYTRGIRYLRWLKKLWATRAHRLWKLRVHVPVGEAQLRAYINDDCLEEIVDRETAGTWNPTIYNYAGSGAYGLPQALPGWKMASHGADWRTNPKTQIAWMRRYVIVRYGGSCAALAYHNANGSY